MSTNGQNGHDPHADDLLDMAGRQPGDEGWEPFNTKRANAKQAEDSKYGSAQAATVVSGLYAAEHGLARGKFPRGKGGYDAVAALEGIQAASAKAAGLIDCIPSEADVVRFHRERGDATWALPAKASVTPAGLKAAIKGLDPTRKIALTTIEALAAKDVRWAVAAHAKAVADTLDAEVKAKPHSLTLAQLHGGYDAPVDDLIELPAMTIETRLASLRLLKDWAAAENLRAQSDARIREAARKTAGHPEPELFIPKAYVRDQTPHLVEGLFKGGDYAPSALLVARRKAGKSTTCDELAYSLATGQPFCGQLPTHLPAGSKVVILDTEMSSADINDTYVRSRPLLDDRRVWLWSLIGNAGLANVQTEPARRYWDSRIPEGSVIIVDCLSPILSAAGITENSDEVALVLDGLIALAKERRSALFVAHHMGKDEEKGSRGHSVIEGKFGSVIYLTFKGDMPSESTPRQIRASGRSGIGLSSRKITRNADGHLVMDGDAKATGVADAAERQQRDEAVLQMISLHPAKSVKALAETYDARQNKWTGETIRDSLARLANRGRAANLGNGGGHQWVPQWLRDPHMGESATLTPDNANGLAVDGSTAHEEAVRVCVVAICAFVGRDMSQENLPETKMLAALQRPGYPPRKIHIAAYHRWKAACDEAGATVTDPAKVPTLPTPEWSSGQTGHRWNDTGRGD